MLKTLNELKVGNVVSDKREITLETSGSNQCVG